MSTWNVSNETALVIVAAVVPVVVLIATIRRAAPKRVRTTQGWWPDPFGRHEVRYYDGKKWTDFVFDKGVSSVDPAIVSPTAPQVGQS